jgi:5'-AMP-activated protein kinase regulatory beta subunit
MAPARKKPTTFQLHAPEAESVLLSGTFNNWDVANLPMKRDRRGTWKRTINLEPGTYEYRFIVNGEWSDDPACEERSLTQFGTYNCVIRID